MSNAQAASRRLLLAPLLAVAACGGGADLPAGAPAEPTPAGVTLRPGVTVLATGSASVVSGAPGRVMLRQPAGGPAGVAPGTIFVSGGRAYRAGAVAATAEAVEVETSEPTFDEVVEALDLHGETTLRTEDVQLQTPGTSVRGAAAQAQGGAPGQVSAASVGVQVTPSALVFTLQDVVVADVATSGASARIVASGTVRLDAPTIKFDVSANPFAPPVVKLVFRAGEAIDLKIEAPAAAFSASYVVPLAAFQVPIPYTAGLVSLGGRIELVVRADGEAHAVVTFTQSAAVDAGLVGQGSPWTVTPYQNVTSSFTAGAPVFTGTLGLGAHVGPRLSLLVLQFDTAGVYARAGVDALAHAVVAPTLQCADVSVDASFGVNGYVNLPFYGVDAPLYARTWPLYAGQVCAP